MQKQLLTYAVFLVIAVAGQSSASASERQQTVPVLSGHELAMPSGCIGLWPDPRRFDSMMPDAEQIRDITKEMLDGTAAHLLVYQERKSGHAYPAFERHPREMFLFRTNNGRFVVRIGEPWSNAEDAEFPPDHGPY
jgi:hypothetical protein